MNLDKQVECGTCLFINIRKRSVILHREQLQNFYANTLVLGQFLYALPTPCEGIYFFSNLLFAEVTFLAESICAPTESSALGILALDWRVRRRVLPFCFSSGKKNSTSSNRRWNSGS